jgi:hypothetical protein
MQRVAELYAKHIADIYPVTTTTSIQMFSSVTGKRIGSDQLGPVTGSKIWCHLCSSLTRYRRYCRMTHLDGVDALTLASRLWI